MRIFSGIQPTGRGDLNRMHQFKEKSARQRELVSAGLFFYPVLQAADVLAYRAEEVPVGADQRQHIELMRDIAIRFNERFGETFVVPRHRIPETGARIMDLQEPERIVKKVKGAVTVSGRDVVRSAEKPGISNLIEVMATIRGTEHASVELEFDGAGYGGFKQAVADAVVEYLTPVRERYAELRADEPALEQVLAQGAERARAIAGPTLADVRERMGVGPPR